MIIPLTQMPGALDLRHASHTDIESALSADRHGNVRAILVTSEKATAAQAILDRCWHDAALIVVDAGLSTAQAA